MCAGLQHRGPDSNGFFLSGPVGLAIQRLRVIDLSTGDQPIFNEDRSVVVVFNGEIYNYRELRERLRAAGHRFTTQSDTEVIVHLYEEEGRACVESLHGMFAFAVWDLKRRQLLLARDRVGKKPLFYSDRPAGLTFASELGALMQDREIPADVDHQGLDCYLAYHYVPAPFTAFRAVKKLPSASTLLYREGTIDIEQYWRLDYADKWTPDRPEEAHEAIREAIRRAVRRRMVSDVPMGAFLSGGVDSSAVVAAMAEASPEPVKTFTIGFESDKVDEMAYARRVAQQFGTDHHELLVRPEALAIIPKIVEHHGEPFGDASAIPTFYLAELTRRHVTVALNGDGGDEAFGGYPRYTSNLFLHRLDGLPVGVRRAMSALGALLPASGTVDSSLNRVRRMARTLVLDPRSRYMAYMSSFGGLQRDELYTDQFRAMIGGSVADDVMESPWRESSARGMLDRMLDVDIRTYLPGDLLAKVDIATMAYSLEARSPLLDHEFLQLAASLPAEMKVRGMQKKVALRDALRPWLPGDLLDRPKQGFELPVAEWFRTDLRNYVRDVILDRAAIDRGYFRSTYIARLLDRHVAGVEDNSRGLWALLMFELWHQQVLDRRHAPPAAVDQG